MKALLAADRTPLWFSAAVLLIGAGGTYLIAPRVNAEFEAQKIKTDFVIRNYNDLRTKMEDFQGLYAVTVQKQVASEDIRDNVSRLQEMIARVGAQNIAMLPMFTTANGPKAASEVNAAMNGMMAVIFSHAGKTFSNDEETAAYNAAVAKAMQNLVRPLLELYVRIGDIGRLRPTKVTTDLKEE